MSDVDYTEIRDDKIRGKICELMSEMLDNPDKHGIYPTSRFMWKMETYILDRIKKLEAENQRLEKSCKESQKQHKAWYEKCQRLRDVNDKYEYIITKILSMIRNLYSAIPLIQKFDKEFSTIKAQKALGGEINSRVRG